MSEAITKVGMKPPHPGRIIREEILAELGLSVARASEILGVRRAALSDLVNGHASLSPEMALRVEKAFGVSMDHPAPHAGMARQPHHAGREPEKSKPSATSLHEMKGRQLSCIGLLRNQRSWTSAP